MPDKPLTVLTYAASASLAAIALVYLYNPSYILDPGAAAAAVAGADSRLLRRARAVGLANPANDCFINSVLQALAGLDGLRLYLAQEISRRDADRPLDDKEKGDDRGGNKEKGDDRSGNKDKGHDGAEGRIYGLAAYQEGSDSSGSGSDDDDGEEEDDGDETDKGRKPADGRGASKHRKRTEDKRSNGSGGRAGSSGGRPGAGLEREWKSAAAERKARSLLHAEVTRGLRAMLDRLLDNAHATRKTISAAPFVQAIESAFATRVNRNQQDAQELLQVVAERMAEEYHVGRAARRRARRRGIMSSRPSKADMTGDGGDRPDQKQERDGHAGDHTNGGDLELAEATAVPAARFSSEEHGPADSSDNDDPLGEREDGFPLEGQTKHQIECSHCNFIPSSKPTDFIMLTLSVPPRSPATLDECLDQFSKPEHIDDYKCDRCRLEHAVGVLEQKLAGLTSSSDGDKARADAIAADIAKLRAAIRTDPERPPPEVQLPDSRLAPTRRIARSVKIVSFPRVLVIHLSRSSFDPSALGTKNTAKVSYPELLKLGSLTDRRAYRLAAVVTHKGTHHSGHYETFRRQYPYELTAASLAVAAGGESADADDEGVAEARSPTPGAASAGRAASRQTTLSPEPNGRDDSDIEDEALDAMARGTSMNGSSERSGIGRTASRRKRSLQQSSLTAAAKPSLDVPAARSAKTSLDAPTVAPTTKTTTPTATTTATTTTKTTATTAAQMPTDRSRQQFRDRYEEAKERKREKRLRKLVARENGRWWRISDDRVRECRTQDVLDMSKEAYLLFYEMEQPPGASGRASGG